MCVYCVMFCNGVGYSLYSWIEETYTWMATLFFECKIGSIAFSYRCTVAAKNNSGMRQLSATEDFSNMYVVPF